jgi:hypothetical protein
MNASPIGAEMKLKKDLQRECTRWMYNTIYSINPSEDKDGKIVQDYQPRIDGDPKKDRKFPNIWIFTGYFNTLLKPPTIDGTPKIKRAVTIKDEDRIFCEVGSSHAGDIWEQKRLQARGIKKSLIDIARSIQNTYQQIRLTVDGVLVELEPVEVGAGPEGSEDGPIEITIPDDDPAFDPPKRFPLVKYYDHLPIKAKDKALTAGVAHIRLLGPFDAGTSHIIDMYTRSAGDEPTGDIQYEIYVRYHVTVER